MFNITQQEYEDVFKHVITTFLYMEDIDKVYKVCKTMKNMIDNDWKVIYHDCQHHQPHNPGEHDEPVIDKWGSQLWYKEGKLHRDGGLPSIIIDDSVLLALLG